MLSITNFPPAIFSKLASKPGTYQNFIMRADRIVQTIERGKVIVAQQIKPTSIGSNGSVQTGSYPDIFTGRPVTSFQPSLPNQDVIASQIKEVANDALAVPHALPYKNFIEKPLDIGVYLNRFI
jgi:hypothetical protein